MTKKTFKRMVWLFCINAALTACKNEVEIVEVVRSIKTMTVSDQPAEKIFKFSGQVAAVDSSGLSFQVGGQVESVEVDIGDRVKKGQVLAVLDPEPYELEVDAAQAELVKARENITKTKAEYERQKNIFEQGAGAARYVEVAEYNYKAALSAVNFQIAKLDQARRDLRKTKLLSPYDGVIAWRSVQPNEEVKVGQKILEINASGKMEVELAIPETTVDRIHIDDPATITFPTLPGESTKGRISYIGGAAVKANAFPVKVELIGPNEKVKPGMTAEAVLTAKDENRKPGFLVPMQAVLPSAEPDRGYAFVYDPGTSTVKKTPIRSRGTENKKVIVGEGLAAGDIIAVAGVSFLADGMEVKLLEGSGK
ncbi:MAG: efflux RND transporter periplasmic adaptor subunit [Desulfobacteraceae bacterium]|jgi:RND family efflux transporter MFP subunit|nr:efflux RND transporter periplasmic adaptor subunit [Desulfobacteraceae bacterium]